MAALLLGSTLPALAQVDFIGEWAPRFHEDQPERIPGPELGDYLGIPVNDALRLRADSWDADLVSMPERQCNPHPATYSFRGPANLRVSKEADPVTQEIVSYTIYGTFGRATRVIWMDGRAHPSANAAHTWAGFSTGKWEGGILRGNIYMLSVAGRNITLSVGPEGVLLVDAGLAAWAPQIVSAIQKLSIKPIRCVIDTNADEDHAGGNAAFAKIGRPVGAGGAGSQLFADIAGAEPRADIYAHINVLNRLAAAPADGWPTSTYFNESKELFFNDEAVQIIHQPAAHTDGDSMVFFRRSDVLSTGDLFDTTGYPRIDRERGGTIQGIIEGLNRILDITIPAAQQEGGTMVIPGHGRLCDEADVVEYRDMVTILRDRIQDMKRNGMTLDQVIAARPTRDYDGRYGAISGPWTTERFVEAVYGTI